jgi:hypothetical protein
MKYICQISSQFDVSGVTPVASPTGGFPIGHAVGGKFAVLWQFGF